MTVHQPRGGASWYYRFWRRHRLYERGGYTTKRAAQEAEWERRREVGALGPRQSGPPRPDHDVRLEERVPVWLASIRGEVEAATLASYRERLTTHVLPTLGGMRLRDIEPSDVKRLLAAKRVAGYAKNSVRLIRAALSALLSDAVEDGILRTNPAVQLGRRQRRRGDRLSPAERTQHIRPMSRETRDALLATARTHAPRLAPVLELLVKTGMRPSEAFALRLEDVDLQAGVVTIERAWVLGEEKRTKTGEARTVDLTPGLVATFRPLVKKAQRGGPLFTTTGGERLDKSRVRKTLRRLLHLAAHDGDPEAARACRKTRRETGGCPITGWRYRLYDLKHTYVSLRLAAGAPLPYVAKQTGVSAVTLLRHYARWIPSGGREWVERDES